MTDSTTLSYQLKVDFLYYIGYLAMGIYFFNDCDWTHKYSVAVFAAAIPIAFLMYFLLYKNYNLVSVAISACSLVVVLYCLESNTHLSGLTNPFVNGEMIGMLIYMFFRDFKSSFDRHWSLRIKEA